MKGTAVSSQSPKPVKSCLTAQTAGLTLPFWCWWPDLNRHGFYPSVSILLQIKIALAKVPRRLMEATPGFEPGNQGFADPRLTAWLCRHKKTVRRIFWSGRRDSNPRHSPWQGDALPLSHSRILILPHCSGGSYRARTYDPLLVGQLLSQLS